MDRQAADLSPPQAVAPRVRTIQQEGYDLLEHPTRLSNLPCHRLTQAASILRERSISLSKERRCVKRSTRGLGPANQFDAMVDFDAVLRDRADPEKIREDMQRGDHLHPNAAGYKAMSDAVDLSLFSKFPKSNFRLK